MDTLIVKNFEIKLIYMFLFLIKSIQRIYTLYRRSLLTAQFPVPNSITGFGAQGELFFKILQVTSEMLRPDDAGQQRAQRNLLDLRATHILGYR